MFSGRACARQTRPHSLTASLQTTSGALLGFGLGCRRRRRFRRRRGGRFRRRRGGRFSRRRRGRFRSRRSRRRHRLALATADDHHGRQQTHTQTSQPPLTHSHGHTLHRGSRVVFACRPARRRPPCPRGPRGPARTEHARGYYTTARPCPLIFSPRTPAASLGPQKELDAPQARPALAARRARRATSRQSVNPGPPRAGPPFSRDGEAGRS